MVSSTREVELSDLLKTLDRLRREFGDSPEYQTWRRRLPADWPL